MRRYRYFAIHKRSPLANLAVAPGVAILLIVTSQTGITRDNAAIAALATLPGYSGDRLPPAPASSVGLRYHVTEIPLRYGLSTDRLAIDDSGDVCGTYQNHENKHRGDCAFFYHNGTVTDIKSESDDRTTAVGLNNRGQVLVYRRNLKGIDAPFVWQASQFAALGPLPKGFAVSNRGYVDTVPVGECKVCSINTSGDVAGYLEQGELPSDGMPEVRPFRWHDGVFTLATESSQPGATREPIVLPVYPTILEDGVFNFQAQAMNDNGDIVGDSPGGGFVGSGLAAVVWKNGHGTAIQVAGGNSALGLDLKALAEKFGSVDSIQPNALNNRTEWAGVHDGLYVGLARLREAISFGVRGGHACLWPDEETGVQDLSETLENLTDYGAAQRTPIGSEAYGMNDKSEIVGEIDDVVTIPRTGKRLDKRVCVWFNRKAYDLNAIIDQQKSCRLSRAWAVNNSGQIVAVGPRVDFHDPVYLHGYILTPVRANRNEPADPQGLPDVSLRSFHAGGRFVR